MDDKRYARMDPDDTKDEIDLYDLMMRIWKWKYLIFTVVVIFTLFSYIYIKLSPSSTIPDSADTYNISAAVKIGKIANVFLESIEDIKLYLTSDKLKDEILKSKKYKYLLRQAEADSQKGPKIETEKTEDKDTKEKNSLYFRFILWQLN